MCGRQLLYKNNGKRRGNETSLLSAIFVCVVGGVLVCVGVWQLTGTHTNSVHINVRTDKLLHLLDDKFLSLGLDSSRICDGWVTHNIRYVEITK